MTEPVDLQAIAEHLGVKHQTARVWVTRGVLPAPKWRFGGVPVWELAEIHEWAVETGRLPHDADS